MRIKAFCKFVETKLTPVTLHDATVVVDGHNFFYQSYDRAGLNTDFGIESDRYASYIKEQLSMFKKAKVKCYFLFKGGHENLQMRLKLENNNWPQVPTFMKEIYKQVLQEMQFEYVECEYESKKDIIEIAQRLNCPVISYDIEFCFSGVRYIPSSTLTFNADDNSVSCGYFLFADFLSNHRLSSEKMALFIILRDERLFSEDTFVNFFKHLRAPPAPYKRNMYLLNWLSRSDNVQIKRIVFEFISADDQKKFVEEENKARSLIERRESGGLGAARMLDPGAARVWRADPRWFAKGIAQGHVAIDYVNVYRNKVVFGAPLITGFEQDNATLLSLEIIFYAYDLLTNFKNDGLTFVYEVNYTDQGKRTMEVTKTHSIRKPVYEAETSVFENGWESVRSLGLLEHFLRETLQLASLRRLDRAPAPARLLLLALAYCARRRPDMPRALPAVALLAHVALDLVHDKADKDKLPKFPFDKRPILDSNPDIDDVTVEDCNIAAAILKDYFHSAGRDAEHTLDRSLLHSLAQYQLVVLQLQNLNALCGAALRAPVLARSYNGTLAYRLLQAAERAADPVTFLDDLLSPAPSVCAYLNGLLEIYEYIL